MSPPVARSSREAHLYMDLTPCPCGEARFDPMSTLIALPDGDLARRYTGACPRCDRPREFEFRLSPETPDAEVRFGGDEPSHLIDAGEWLWIADRYSRSLPANPHRLPDPDRGRARTRLASAAAAIDETLKFVLPGGTEVPSSAIWTALGRSVYDSEPGRFRVGRLVAVRDAYLGALRKFG